VLLLVVLLLLVLLLLLVWCWCCWCGGGSGYGFIALVEPAHREQVLHHSARAAGPPSAAYKHTIIGKRIHVTKLPR
jgi:hypothetical protein